MSRLPIATIAGLTLSLVVAACSSGSSTTTTNDDPSEPRGGEADAGSSSRNDASTSPADAAPTDPPDAAPINTPLFTFVMDGKTVAPTKVDIEKHGYINPSSPEIKGEVEGSFELTPGPDDGSDVPYLTLDIYTPLQGMVPYSSPQSTAGKNSVYLQYHYQRPGVSGFPKARGAGMNIVRDGRDGWFEGTATGTFPISDGSGNDVDHTFTLTIRQPVSAMP